MKEANKLVVGKPYEIVYKDNGRFIKVRGNALTEDDVNAYIKCGIITAEDVCRAQEKKDDKEIPDFSIIERIINRTFKDIPDFCKKFYKEYPTVAFSMFLREYSRYFRATMPIMRNHPIYIVSTSDYSAVEIKNPTEKDLALSCFSNKEIAEKCAYLILKGFYGYAK